MWPKVRIYLPYTAAAIFIALFAKDCDDSEPKISLYSPRIIDLSSLTDKQMAGPGFDPKTHWLTTPHAGVACWNKDTDTYFVYPIGDSAEEANFNGFQLTSFELPKPTPALIKAFHPGLHLSCHPSQSSSVDIQIANGDVGMGKISVHYNGQGWPMDYSGDEQYLF